MLLPSKDIVGYISSMPIYFDCHVILQQNEENHHLQFLLGKNVHATDYDPAVETFFINFNTIKIMSEVMVDYDSVSLLFFFFFFFFFFSFSDRPHYANTPVQYTAILHGCKNVHFQVKNCDIFLIFAQNIDCGYSLERPH